MTQIKKFALLIARIKKVTQNICTLPLSILVLIATPMLMFFVLIFFLPMLWLLVLLGSLLLFIREFYKSLDD